MVGLSRHSAVLLEGVARAVESGEPVLLVGETGVGKTASVQFLAQQTGRQGSQFWGEIRHPAGNIGRLY